MYQGVRVESPAFCSKATGDSEMPSTSFVSPLRQVTDAPYNEDTRGRAAHCCAEPQEAPMDLVTAVATSMLGVSRLKAAAVFKSLSQSRSAVTLELVLDGLGVAWLRFRVPGAIRNGERSAGASRGGPSGE